MRLGVSSRFPQPPQRRLDHPPKHAGRYLAFQGVPVDRVQKTANLLVFPFTQQIRQHEHASLERLTLNANVQGVFVSWDRCLFGHGVLETENQRGLRLCPFYRGPLLLETQVLFLFAFFSKKTKTTFLLLLQIQRTLFCRLFRLFFTKKMSIIQRAKAFAQKAVRRSHIMFSTRDLRCGFKKPTSILAPLPHRGVSIRGLPWAF